MRLWNIGGKMFITKRKLNKKLDLLLKRQTMMMEILLSTHLTYDGVKKIEKKWNKLWYEIMGERE